MMVLFYSLSSMLVCIAAVAAALLLSTAIGMPLAVLTVALVLLIRPGIDFARHRFDPIAVPLGAIGLDALAVSVVMMVIGCAA